MRWTSGPRPFTTQISAQPGEGKDLQHPIVMPTYMRLLKDNYNLTYASNLARHGGVRRWVREVVHERTTLCAALYACVKVFPAV